MLLCDGIGCDGYVWRYLRADLGARFGLHPHYRGHGRTAPPRDPQRVNIEDLADDVACVLDDALVERAVLIGHSMGVQVALETYRRHPERVAGLVLVCGAPSHPLRTFRGSAVLEELLPTIQRWIHRVPGVINRVTRAVLPTRIAYEIASRLEIRRELVEPADFMPYLEGMARVDARLFVAMLSAAGAHSADELLATIATPTLVVAGGRDGFTPPERSRAMAATIPGAELLEIPNASHTAPIERPNLVNQTVREFLTRRIDGEVPDSRDVGSSVER
ncbi:MAG: alpha/beta hydrolase [Deltaproteobacteria bacterium]|nr:alpha/beta hydrolase [Deltaproteobacteria bacterium]MCW5806534.1 alpha/beta hydrolase [Deltaproteobacteria bacterium]